MDASEFDEADFFRRVPGPVKRIFPADEATRARVRELAERPLSIEEWRARQAIPITAAEHQNTRELVRWFTRRYPTPAARMAYIRRAYRRWMGWQSGSPRGPGVRLP